MRQSREAEVNGDASSGRWRCLAAPTGLREVVSAAT